MPRTDLITPREQSAGSRQLKILLSEGSSTSARQTLYALAPLRHVIDVCDSQQFALCRFSRYVRRWRSCPALSADPTGYLQCVLDQLKEVRYDVLFPVHDQVYLFAKFRDALRRRVGLAVPEFEAVRQVQSKTAISRLFHLLKIPQPRIEILSGIAELNDPERWQYPCWVKIDVATAGRGVWHMREPDDLPGVIATLRRLERAEPLGNILVQQPAVGNFCMAQVVFQHGRLVAAHCFRARAVGAGRSAVARESVSHPKALEHVGRLGAHLNWHGAMHSEYFHDAASGEVQFIEANPRIGETVNAMLSGVNLCDALLRVSLDEPPPPWQESKPGVLTHAVFTQVLGVAERGEGRLAILTELKRVLLSRGIYENSQEELTRPRDDYWSVIPLTAVTLQLLAWPGFAPKLIQRAVDNYALNSEAARLIDALPSDLIV